MDLESIYSSYEEFRILQTRHHSQTAVIRLEKGKATGNEPQSHNASEQIVLVLEGEFFAEIGDESKVVTKGESLVIGAGVKHKLSNRGEDVALAFTVYAPPVYPPALPRG
jgi:mannose-6-phosphate isomerase-like protein (cupin superfamily)